MLEFEGDNRKLLANKFRPQLDCAHNLLEVGQRLSKALTEHLANREEVIEPRTGMVVLLLLAQLLRRCRAAVVVWEFGYSPESEVMSRSLFESHLAARFVIDPQVPQPHWSPNLYSEFNELCNLSGSGTLSRFTDINFRAMLYASSMVVKLDHRTDKLKALPMLRGTLPSDFGDKMRQSAGDAETAIGRDWSERIRKTQTFHGFRTIKLLAEYCGADKSHYYETLYGLQSGSTHGEGALALMHNPSPADLSRALCVPCAILGDAFGDFERVFSLGFLHELHQLADRIRHTFATDAPQ
jgi:hypothetical protein